MTQAQEITMWAAIISPVVALLGYLLATWSSRKNAVEAAQTAGRNAATTEFAVLTEGFKASFARQDQELEQVRKELKEEKQLREETDACVVVMFDHIVIMEELVPDPPGAPPRPKLPQHLRPLHHTKED